VNPQDPQSGKRTPVADEMARYLVELRGKKRSDATLKLFREAFEDWDDYCRVVRVSDYVEGLKKENFLSFGEWLGTDRAVARTKNGVELTVTKKHNGQTTVSNKLRRMSQWQRWSMKLEPGKGLITVGDAPIDDDTEVEEYTREELDKFFAACKPDEHLLFTFFLESGFREKEVSTLPWSDLNLTTGIVKVQKRPEYGFTPKNRMSRSVKLPTVLAARLTIWRSQNLTAKLVFPSLIPDVPDGHMLRRLKQVAKRAGLNADEWWLHKFRATYATGLLRGGMDIKQVQVLLGHRDIGSTMKYLAAIHVERMGTQIDSIQFGSE
jgi:integrase